MTAKQYLQQYAEYDIAANEWQVEADRLYAEVTRMNAPLDVPPMVRTKYDKMLANYTDAAESAIANKIKAIECRDDISQTISQLPVRRYRNILTAIYINGKTQTQIANEKNCHPRTIARWHKSALAMLERYI